MQLVVTIMDAQLLPQAVLTFTNGLGSCLVFDIALTPIKMTLAGIISMFLCIKVSCGAWVTGATG